MLSAAVVQTHALDEHAGPGACADGADRADRPFFRICNAYVHGRNGFRRVLAGGAGGRVASTARYTSVRTAVLFLCVRVRLSHSRLDSTCYCKLKLDR